MIGLRRRAASAAVRLAARLNGKVYLALDHPPAVEETPRWGYGRPEHARLAERLARGEDEYARRLDQIVAYANELRRIPRDQAAPGDPWWLNPWFSGLDAASLYALIRSTSPARYVEIGSGLSTMFAARARRDGGFPTSITSIDPQPRAGIDELCDEVHREPLENVGLEPFRALAAGDIVLFDGSHRVFMNSDVTAFFLDVLPELPPRVLVGVHDIYLPEDYPPEGASWHLSEQYMLAAYLLANPSWLEPVLPLAYVTRRPQLDARAEPLLSDPHFEGVTRRPTAFWLRTGAL